MQITTLIDCQESADFRSEFGLSFLLREGEREYLFDAGAGGVLSSNLVRAGIRPESVRDVILSHGHYDHTGGLRFLSPSRIFCGPGIRAVRYSRHADGEMHELTMPELAQRVFCGAEIHWIRDFRAISENLYLTGPIPRVSGESCGGDFFCDEGCRLRDAVSEELALLSRDGILITGCCHAGIINTLTYCREKRPEIRVRKIVGGLHLLHAGEERLQKTALFLRGSGIRELHLLHCTGERAVEYLRQALPECSVSTPQLGIPFEV